MANTLLSHLDPTTVSTTATVYYLKPGDYSVTIGDGGALANCYLKFWDGAAWVAFSDSDGTASQGFTITVPGNTKVQIVFTAGNPILQIYPV